MRLTCYYLCWDGNAADQVVGAIRNELSRNDRFEIVPIDGDIHTAVRRCIDAPTPFTLVVAGDVLLYPGAIRTMVRRFALRVVVRPRIYRCGWRVSDPLTENAYPGYVTIYRSDALARIGRIDVPTAVMPADYRASIFGMASVECEDVVGEMTYATPRDVYRTWFWARIRYRLNLFTAPIPSVTEHLFLWKTRTREIGHLYAAAGIADADGLRPRIELVDPGYLGRIGSRLKFNPLADESTLRETFGLADAERRLDRRRAA